MKNYNYIVAGLLLTIWVVSAVSSIVRNCIELERLSNSPSVAVSAPAENLSVDEIKSDTAPAPALPAVCYELTAEERDLVERVVMAEAGGEPYEGQQAVAQCILNACVLQEARPAEVVARLKYTKARPEPTEAVNLAVAAVFDEGVKVIDPNAIYFYAPARVASAWHESQVYVCTIGEHRFFKEASP